LVTGKDGVKKYLAMGYTQEFSKRKVLKKEADKND